MSTYYGLSIAASLLLGMGLYAVRLHRGGKNGHAAAAALPISAALAFVLAKAIYVLLQMNYVWPKWGAASLLRMAPTEFSFFGGLLGALLGVLIAGKIFHLPLGKNLDLFAPSLALTAALWKFSEYFLGSFGSGSYVENESLQFFPVAVVNEWEEWYYAIFMLVGLCALMVLAVSLLRGHRCMVMPGLLFGRVVFYLALPMIICESLREECMKWGFVKCEQLLCGLTIGAIIFLLCLALRKGGLRRWPPFIGVVFIMIGLVGVEFMLDKLSYPEYVGYSIMLVLLALLAVLECFTVRRLRKA